MARLRSRLLSYEPMDWYEPEVRALEAARRLRPRRPRPAVFYGSSTIRLWSDLQHDLDAPDALNLGFGGSTLEACVYFFDRLIVPESPGTLILYAGDNDIGDGRSPEQLFQYFEKFLALLGKVDLTSFCFISIKPSPARFPLIDRIRETNRLLRNRMEHLPQAHFIDLFPAMLQPDCKPNAELFEDDGLHMNQAGYQLWSRLLIPYRNKMFMAPSYAIQSSTVI